MAGLEVSSSEATRAGLKMETLAERNILLEEESVELEVLRVCRAVMH